MLDAIVLAGGPHDEIAALAEGAPNKAFVPIAGVTLVERTLVALRAAPSVDRITVVAPQSTWDTAALRLAGDRRPAGETMTQSLRSGLADRSPDVMVLVTASDLPILTPEAIEEFVALAMATDADLVYACVERAAHEARFPDVAHTWARLQDGTFCGGGAIAMRPRVLPAIEGLLGRLGAARKNPLALAAIFGPHILARYAVGRLRIAHAERRASELAGARVAAAICTRAEIAYNVDRASDVAGAERIVTTSA